VGHSIDLLINALRDIKRTSSFSYISNKRASVFRNIKKLLIRGIQCRGRVLLWPEKVQVRQFCLLLADNFTNGEIIFNRSSRKMRTTGMTSFECVLRKRI
jgi:hypothetical protein